MEKSTLRRADLVFSIVLMIISILVMIESVKIFFNPFGRKFDLLSAESIKDNIVNWYHSPALLPAVLAVIMLLLAIALMHVAIRDGARLDFFKKEKIIRFLENRELHTAIIVIFTLCAYTFFLIPFCRSSFNFFPRFQGFPFMVATFIYLLSMMIIFNKRKTVKEYIKLLIISAGAAVVITYGFNILALIPLP